MIAAAPRTTRLRFLTVVTALALPSCTTQSAHQPRPPETVVGDEHVASPSESTESSTVDEPDSAAATPAVARPLPNDLLECELPWDCTLTEDLRGVSVNELVARFGKPHWSSGGKTIFKLGGSCVGDSQFIELQTPAGDVVEASTYWNLAYGDCEDELETLKPHSKPLDLCPRFSKQCPAVKALESKTDREVVHHLGLPHVVEANVWTYRYPRDCSDERVIVTLTLRSGRAVSAKWDHEWTGEHCLPAEDF